jgi:hypothetical protein
VHRPAYATKVPRARTLDHEFGLVREAIAMVASGGAPRIVLAGLRFSARLIQPARQVAAGTGVRIVPLWRADGVGLDIAVDSVADD